jgi:hypothetical protein
LAAAPAPATADKPAATPSISAEYLVDGSRVEGLFDKGWFAGTIRAEIKKGRTGFTVKYDDGELAFYTQHQARKDLRHAASSEDPSTTFWNITHDLLLNLKEKNLNFELPGVACPLTGSPLVGPAYKDLLNLIVRRKCESPENRRKIICFLDVLAGQQKKRMKRQWAKRVEQFLSSVGHEPAGATDTSGSAAMLAGPGCGCADIGAGSAGDEGAEQSTRYSAETAAGGGGDSAVDASAADASSSRASAVSVSGAGAAAADASTADAPGSGAADTSGSAAMLAGPGGGCADVDAGGAGDEGAEQSTRYSAETAAGGGGASAVDACHASAADASSSRASAVSVSGAGAAAADASAADAPGSGAADTSGSAAMLAGPGPCGGCADVGAGGAGDVGAELSTRYHDSAETAAAGGSGCESGGASAVDASAADASSSRASAVSVSGAGAAAADASAADAPGSGADTSGSAAMLAGPGGGCADVGASAADASCFRASVAMAAAGRSLWNSHNIRSSLHSFGHLSIRLSALTEAAAPAGAAGAADSDSAEAASEIAMAFLMDAEEEIDVNGKRERGPRGTSGEMNASKRPRAKAPVTNSKRQRDNSCQEGGDGKRQRLPDIDSATVLQMDERSATNPVPPANLLINQGVGDRSLRPHYKGAGGRAAFILTEPIHSMGDNEGMERSKIMQSLVVRGCRLEENAKAALEAILGYAQRHMSLQHLAGFGEARAVVVGVLKQPVSSYAQSKLSWSAGTERRIALKMEIEGLGDKELHNSETVREAQILLECIPALHRSTLMQKCLAQPVKCLSTTSGECSASAAFYRRGKGKVYIFSFFQLEADVGGLSCFDAVPKLWSENGQVDNTTRLLVRGLCHMLNFMNNVAGMAQLDCVLQNFAEVLPRHAFPGMCPEIRDAMPRPALVKMIAWGGCVRIGTSHERKDKQPRPRAVAPAPLQRLSTKAGSQGNAASGPALPRVKENFGVLDNATITNFAVHRKEAAGGVGRPRGGNPAHSCPLIEYVLGKAKGDERLDADLALLSQSYGVGSVLYHEIFCKPKPVQTMEQVLLEKEKACQSAEAMLQTMKSRVPPGLEVQQEAKLYANLMWNLMRAGNTRPGASAKADTDEELTNIVAELKATRIPVQDILRHTVLTNLTFSKEQSATVQGVGLPIGGVPLPSNCPFASEAQQVPIWNVKPDGPNGSWGNGAFADQDIEPGQLAAVYVGLDYSYKSSRDVCELAPGNHNATLFDGSADRGTCVGELPLEVLQAVGGVGVFFNAKTLQQGANLVLKRKQNWRDGRGLLYIPMYARVAIKKGEGGYWDYDPAAGAGGADSYTFDDSIFKIR